MIYYFPPPTNNKKFSGTPRMTLPTAINQDIKNAIQTDQTFTTITQFKNINDLFKLKEIAQDRTRWRELVDTICIADDE